jgi:hypothetical protein
LLPTPVLRAGDESTQKSLSGSSQSSDFSFDFEGLIRFGNGGSDGTHFFQS